MAIDITMYNRISDIPLAGTMEHTEQMNAQLLDDLKIYATRPFLNGQEKRNLGEYFNTWSTNNIIALLNFDQDGNYLPNLYQAPTEYLRMLYPIDDLMTFERQGTLVIDREQYSPELRRLSFFIYMVDEELYDQYKTMQHFNGPTAPTFMFDKDANNGVRIFRDYFALARHLRKQRRLTYVLGYRTMFYLRYFLYQIHVHTISTQYAYGEHVDGTVAKQTLEAVKRHLAFNAYTTDEYHVHVTVDKYQLYRVLLKNALFKMNLPETKEFDNTTTMVRYQKQSMRGRMVTRVKRNKLRKYEEFDIHDYHHSICVDNYRIFFIWDTRVITNIVPIDRFSFDDFSPVQFDNGTDLCCKANASKEIREICEQVRMSIAIQMRDNA